MPSRPSRGEIAGDFGCGTRCRGCERAWRKLTLQIFACDLVFLSRRGSSASIHEAIRVVFTPSPSRFPQLREPQSGQTSPVATLPRST